MKSKLQMNRKELYAKMENKFLKGQKEHQNDLKDLSPDELIEEALNEAIDLVFYLSQLKGKAQSFGEIEEIPQMKGTLEALDNLTPLNH